MFKIHDYEQDVTHSREKIISLNEYSIDTYYGENDVYVPLTFLSDMFGGTYGYNIAYNGKDIYVLDYFGEVFGTDEIHDIAYYGDKYYEILSDLQTPREIDVVNYTYNQLCFTFDNLRGYTVCLRFLDNNLLSLGLDTLLDYYHPSVKKGLLSTDKEKYYAALETLFYGLYDNGHTGLLAPKNPIVDDAVNVVHGKPNSVDPHYVDIMMNILEHKYQTIDYWQGIIATRNETMPEYKAMYDEKNKGITVDNEKRPPNFYYIANDENKIAYIGFEGFDIDYEGWDKFYKGEIDEETLMTSDTFAYVRNKLIQAKKDGMQRMVLDISTNGGGSLGTLTGLVALLNGGKAMLGCNYTLNQHRITRKSEIDFNLDGVFDEQDILEAQELVKDLKIGILISPFSFSAANLFPTLMQELGFPILGEPSSGGSCSVMLSTTAEGMGYVHSSPMCLTNLNGENVDIGVMPQIILQREEKWNNLIREYRTESYYRFSTVATMLDQFYENKPKPLDY